MPKSLYNFAEEAKSDVRRRVNTTCRVLLRALDLRYPFYYRTQGEAMRVINFYKKSIFQAYKKPKNVEVYEETLNLPELGGRIRLIQSCKSLQTTLRLNSKR